MTIILSFGWFFDRSQFYSGSRPVADTDAIKHSICQRRNTAQNTGIQVARRPRVSPFERDQRSAI
jgi:hypothetical protein